jgi:hypothetical protein
MEFSDFKIGLGQMDEGSIDLFVKPSYSSNKARAATD